MKQIVLFNPAMSSLNLGDDVIFDGAFHVVDSLFPDSYYVNISTHLPVTLQYLSWIKAAKLRFVCGSNLLDSHMLKRFKQWYIEPWHAAAIGPAVLLGVGWRRYESKPDIYTSWLWNRVLSKDQIHSVRDAYAESQLRQIGITNVVNTGCPSLWGLTPEHCATIPTRKAKNVVTTLTDYRQDAARDKVFLQTLLDNYEVVYIWMQGFNDDTYLKSLQMSGNIVVIPPKLSAYDELLGSDLDLEYVGTRLHGGIRALQFKRRSLILGIDNRSREKKADINLPVFLPEELGQLKQYLDADRATELRLHWDNINTWKGQFQ